MRPQCVFSPSFRPIHFRSRRTFCPRRALVNFGSKPHKIRTNNYSSPHFDRNGARATPRMLPTPYSRFPRALCRPILPHFYPFCPRFEDKASLALRTLTRGNLFYHERKLFLSRGEAFFITSAKGRTGLTGVENQGCAHKKAHNDLGFRYLLKFILGGAQEQQV